MDQYFIRVLILISIFGHPHAYGATPRSTIVNCEASQSDRVQNSSDPRICQIDVELRMFSGGHLVTYLENSTSRPSLVAESEWVLNGRDYIHLGDTKFLDMDELRFLLAHEYSHSISNFGRRLVEFLAPAQERGLSDLELISKYGHLANKATADMVEFNHLLELEADKFAIEFLIHKGISPAKAMKGVLQNGASSETNPSRRTRLNQAERMVRREKP